ncbi:MAG: hypothetical protein GX100_02885 [candidate division WS1 bacterium]|jgi:hypothetical protein|nr:hypothetical protein [candidate division WS1 bacterium]
MQPRQIEDPDVRLLATITGNLRQDYDDENQMWDGSPFAWIKTRSSRQSGTIGEKLVAGWCAAKKLNVLRAPDSQCNRLIEGLRTEIKFSTLWQTGMYKFQQFRDQRYDIAICLGLSPFEAHWWVVTKELLNEYVIGVTPQHVGRSGRDTAWLSVTSDNEPDWLAECGGRLADAFPVLQGLTGRA